MKYPTITEITNIDRKAMNLDALISLWLVHDHYDILYPDTIVGLTHLRPLNNEKRANKASPKITHEVLIMSIDPRHNINLDAPYTGWPLVAPPLMNIQFTAKNDTKAAMIINPLIEMIKVGGVGYTTEWTRHWVACIKDGSKDKVYYMG